MKTNDHPETSFLQKVTRAVDDLKARLQDQYRLAYPELSEIIHLVLDEEEANAWELSAFPHLLLPDLVEAHIATINLQPTGTRHDDVFGAHDFGEIDDHQPALALCG